MAGAGGFEPPNAGTKNRCLNHLATPQHTGTGKQRPRDREFAAGMPPGTPAVVIAAASRPTEEVHVVTAGTLAERDLRDIDEPILLGIGEVFSALRLSALIPRDELRRSEAI